MKGKMPNKSDLKGVHFSMNKEQIKYYADEIISKSINITYYNDGNNTCFNNKHNKILQSIINKNKYKYLHEYNDISIARDACYLAYYESLITILEKNNYSDDQLLIISEDINIESHKVTKDFIKQVIVTANNKVKEQLLNRSKYETSSQLIFTDDLSYIEDNVSDNNIDYWFLDYLTKDQKDYIIGNKIYANNNNGDESLMNKRIATKISKINKPTETNYLDYLLSINDNNTFIKEVKRLMNTNNLISELIIDELSAEERIKLNKDKADLITLHELRNIMKQKNNK